MSRYVIAREFEMIEQFDGINPVDLLDEAPQNYLGVEQKPDMVRLPGGSWVFDNSRKVLVYTIKNTDQFEAGLSGRPRVEYQVQLDYQDNNLNQHFDFQLDTLKTLKFVSLGRYRWRSDDD